jgi:hypothetical protein
VQRAYGALTVLPPRFEKRCGTEPLVVWAIRVWEEQTPDGEEPLEWLLLTSVPTTTLEQAWERVGWYEHRWIVEDYHHCLKTGCHLEERQGPRAERLIRRLGLVVGTSSPFPAPAQILLVATLSVLLARSSMRIYSPLWQHRPVKLPR